MTLLKKISEGLFARILDWVFVSLCGSFLALLIWFKDQVAPKLSQVQWLMVAGLLFAGVLILGYCFYKYWKNNRDKPDKKDYFYNIYPPLYVYKKNKNRPSFHCWKCLFKVGHNQSKMGRIKGRGLTCANCDEVAVADDIDMPGIMDDIVNKYFGERFSFYD